MESLQWIALGIGILLQVLLISALLKGAYRQYPVLLAYAISDVLNSVVMATAFFDIGKWTKANAKYYWIGEAVQYTLVFALLLHMLSKVLRKENKGRLLHFVFAGLLYVAFSLWLAFDSNQNLWMTQTLRNINFGSIFLNLTLWTLLLRKRDRQMLMVAAAFGVQFAGVAIGHSLRQLSRDLVWTGNLVITLSYFICLYSLWKAMLPLRRAAALPAVDVASNDRPAMRSAERPGADTMESDDFGKHTRNTIPIART
ncbi:MAG: hypothetical protein JNL98_00120 [Bryobacterales bacterium]|nr:hypothetical protein [Bryobacterales bacterium]